MDRRDFLKGVAIVGAALAIPTITIELIKKPPALSSSLWNYERLFQAFIQNNSDEVGYFSLSRANGIGYLFHVTLGQGGYYTLALPTGGEIIMTPDTYVAWSKGITWTMVYWDRDGYLYRHSDGKTGRMYRSEANYIYTGEAA